MHTTHPPSVLFKPTPHTKKPAKHSKVELPVCCPKNGTPLLGLF